MRNPRYMNSRFQSTCCDCGATIGKGERIRYLGRSKAQCSQCMPPESIAPQTANAAPSGGSFDDWASALAWDDSKPQPGSSIGVKPQRGAPVLEVVRPDGRDNCEQCGKLDELSHNDAVDMALCHDCDTAADAEAAAIDAGVAAAIAEVRADEVAEQVAKIDHDRPAGYTTDEPHFSQAERAEGMTSELLVVLVNAIDVAGVSGRHSVAQFCREQSQRQQGNRAALWARLASAVHAYA